MVADMMIGMSWRSWGGAGRCLSLLKARGATWMLHKGGEEGAEDLAIQGCMCCFWFILRVDGGLHPCHSQRPDLVDCEDGEQVHCAGEGFARSFGGMTCLCCWPSRWNLHAADHSLVCGQRCRLYRQRQSPMRLPQAQLPIAADGPEMS